jgi:hypothetical protein
MQLGTFFHASIIPLTLYQTIYFFNLNSWALPQGSGSYVTIFLR